MPPKITTETAVESSTTKGKQLVVMGDGELTCALPHDTMLPILARLPVKSLCRFKCVCRTWRYLFSNPKFVKIHHDLFSGAPKNCSLQPHLLRVPRLGFDPTRKGQKLDGFVMETCRGLVCMGRPSHTKEIILWNPATNLWKSLPLSKTDFGAADNITLGFGCSDDYDYKVVRIFTLKGRPMKVGAEVYSSKSDSWENIVVPFEFRLLAQGSTAIVNGNPYWEAFTDERKIDGNEGNAVQLGFNSTTMSFKVFEMFMFDMYSHMGKALVDWKGQVGVLKARNRGDGWLKSLDILVYDDATRGWIKGESFEGIKMPQAMCLECSRTGKIAAGCLGGRNKVIVFDPSNKCVVGEGVVSKEIRDSLKMMPYDESLAFVKGMESMLPMKEELQHQHLHDNPFFNINNIDGFFAVCAGISCYYPLAF